MSPTEIRTGMILASVFGLRMLGLFIILPVFAVHAPNLAGGGNLTLVGLALGAYGLAQAVLHIPFGMASDRWGRKPLIVIGLLIFAAGSLLAAAATTIWVAIAGRLLQGAGAISSVVIALAADLTREQHRTKTMAMIGATIGLAFALSLVAAPALYAVIGMGGIFVLSGALAIAAIWVIVVGVPEPKASESVVATPRGALAEAFRPELLRLNLGIFVLHLVQMAMFVVIPSRLVEAGLALPSHWMLYLPAVLGSFIIMVPFIIHADRSRRLKPVLLGAVGLLVAVQAALGVVDLSLAWLAGLMLAFFVAFNILEALIPSLVARLAPARQRGTAIGVYNTTQTLGLFVGGLLGGWLAKHWGANAVFAACAGLAALWLLAAAGMRPVPPPVNELASLTLSIAAGVDAADLREALARVDGVREAQVFEGERIARLTVVPDEWDERTVKKLVMGEA